jgi:hypothetical protein
MRPRWRWSLDPYGMETRHRPARSAVQAAKTSNVTMNRVPFCSCQHGAPVPLSRTFAPTAPGIAGCENRPHTSSGSVQKSAPLATRLASTAHSFHPRACQGLGSRSKESAVLTASRPMMEPRKRPFRPSSPTNGLLYQARLFRGQRRGRIALSPGKSAAARFSSASRFPAHVRHTLGKSPSAFRIASMRTGKT